MSQQRLTEKVKQDLTNVFNRLIRLGGIAGYRDDALPGFSFGEQVQTSADGVIPSARCKISANPTNNDTITIGGSVFKFVTSLAAATTYTQVKIGASLAVTLASLVNAINGVSDVTVVANTTPFVAAVYADLPDTTHLRIRQTSAQGAVPQFAQDPIAMALASSLTQAGDGWNMTDVSLLGQNPTASARRTIGKVTISAAMITYGKLEIDLPFTIGRLIWDGYTSAGVKRAINEAVTFSGSTITLTLAGGGSPNWQATDVFVFEATE